MAIASSKKLYHNKSYVLSPKGEISDLEYSWPTALRCQ